MTVLPNQMIMLIKPQERFKDYVFQTLTQLPTEILVKILKEIPLHDKIKLATVSQKMFILMYQEKSFKFCDLSDFCWVDDDVIHFIDQMCPRIKHLNCQGDTIDLMPNQIFDDIVSPFRFLSSLRLSSCSIIDSLEFLTMAPLTLKAVELDALYLVPAAHFVKYVLYLSKQLTTLYVTRNPQLTKYDLVPMLQKFSQLEILNITDSEYITPGTCEAITRYCYNLEKFFFSLNFRMRDTHAWIGLLGIDLVHIEFSPTVNSQLQTYYMLEKVYERYDRWLTSDEDSD